MCVYMERVSVWMWVRLERGRKREREKERELFSSIWCSCKLVILGWNQTLSQEVCVPES